MVSPKSFTLEGKDRTNIYSKLFLTLIVFTFLILPSIQSVDAFTWNRPTLIVANLNVNHSETSNSSDFWDNLDNPTEIDHSILDNLEWSVAGHTMDSNLDMNDYYIHEVDKIYFDGSSFISSDDSRHIDIHASDIDLHGNLSTIWTIRLNTDGDGPGGDTHGDLIFGSGDVYVYYNGSDFIIDPDAVGTGDVIIHGDIRADNFIGNFTGFVDGINISNLSNQYVPYIGANADVDIENYNLTANWFNGKFNWTVTDDWNSFDGSTLDFNESKLATQFFNASTIEVITGTPQGAIGDLRSYNNIPYNLSEVNSDLELIINFTNIEDFNQLVIRYKSDEENEPHRIQVQIYDIGLSDWENYGDLPETNTYSIVEFGVFDADEHIDGAGTVQVRVFQDEDVPPRTHKHNFDWITIAKGFGTPSGEEVDPDSIHKDGSTMWQGNEVGNSFNTTNWSWGFFNNINVDFLNASGLNLSGNLTFVGSNNPTYIFGGDTSGDDLTLKANTIDTNSFIQMLGGGLIRIATDTGQAITFQEGGNDFAWWKRSSSQLITTAGTGIGFEVRCLGLSTGECLNINSPNLALNISGVLLVNGTSGDTNITNNLFVGNDIDMDGFFTNTPTFTDINGVYRGIDNFITFTGDIGIWDNLEAQNRIQITHSGDIAAVGTFVDIKGINGIALYTGTTAGKLDLTGTRYFSNFQGTATGGTTEVIAGDYHATGNIGTTATTSHTGVQITASGTADNNYAIKIDGVAGATNNYGIWDGSGADWVLDGDNTKLFFGEGQDASIYYDGTNLQINPQEVGSGLTNFTGNVSIDGTLFSDNDCGIPSSTFAYERAAAASNAALAIGNGDALQGSPVACDGVITAIAGACENCDVGVNEISMELRINGASQVCDVPQLTTAYDTDGTTCNVAFSKYDRIGCYSKTETGVVTGIVCTIYARYD